MDTSSVPRPQLPSFGMLDAGPARHHDDLAHGRLGLPSSSVSNSSTRSPSSHNSPSAPSPYGQSYSASTARYSTSWLANNNSGIKTPPGSRRSSGDEKEDKKPAAPRQALPSISDVLAIDEDDRKPFLAQLPAASMPPHTNGASPPSPKSGRPYAMEPPHLPHQKPYASAGYASYRSEAPQAVSQAQSQPSRPAQVPVTEPPRPVQAPATEPPRSTLVSVAEPTRPAPAPVEESHPTSQPPSSHSSTYPPGSAPTSRPNFPVGYTTYTSAYASTPATTTTTTTTTSTSSGPLYKPSTTLGPTTASPPAWKAGGTPRRDERPSGQGNFGTKVKRHLEFYDMELGLNDVRHTSGILSDFARRYGDRIHLSQRAGPSRAMLPSIIEIDDMIAKSRKQHDALVKIREVIIAQQAAYEQQAVDQRQQAKLYSEQPPSSQAPSTLAPPATTDDERSTGFAGADPKKRRGRAAPPGRCHSCNRAETPEWRRGPDGARTLCNACGLHYAKLTRKSNFTKQGTTVTNSNLRPKENGA